MEDKMTELDLNGFKIGDKIMRIDQSWGLQIAIITNVTPNNILLQSQDYSVGLNQRHQSLKGWKRFDSKKAEEIKLKIKKINKEIQNLYKEKMKLL